MTYAILSTNQIDETIIANIEYTFDDNSKKVIDLFLFAPQSLEEITLSITNRGLMEQKKLNDSVKCAELINLLPINQIVNI